ncbi:enoyl-CoA hydratase [Polyangium sp. 15x6]|uniref:enoyl-CoA hydratase n=1 Tax=Polyangium sp. 15x6 TaxID=3042687 RepID=UPI00249C0810|nr:enoyl-CoA hydratase [Polyangium sp. 15x6]MDI3285714.1 enoyl-CoA hydratase [Polyangium sp. 15x6]
MSEQVLLVEHEGPVAVVTLNRPRAKNALDNELLGALLETLPRLGEDASVRAVVLTGAGGAFCAGADLKSAMGSLQAAGGFDAIMDRYHGIIRAIVNAPKPFVAMVEGPAVGFGCDLALACDLRMLGQDAYLEERFVKIGLMPDGGGSFWLPRLVGLGRAMEIMLTGDRISADHALSLGLANHVHPSAELRAETMKLAGRLAKGPPLAYAEIKRSVRLSLGSTIDEALDREKAGQVKLLQSADCMEGVLAWMEKRDPSFQGK